MFCSKKLPLLRDILCSGWDELQSQRTTSRIDQRNVNQPFTAYLKNDDNTMFYELPYYLSHLESTIRSFRSSLSKSEYSSSEQALFHQQFTAYIQQSSVTVLNAQHSYVNIMGTIQLHVSDTNWLVQKLNNIGFSSNVTLHINGPLAQSMKIFNSYCMVYLIGGIEPFKKNVLQGTTVKATQLMKAHVDAISKRLWTDIHMIRSLQTSLTDLANTSEDIERHVSRCTSDSRKESLARSTVWAYIIRHLLGQTFSDYQVDQRRQWLDDMRSVFKDDMLSVFKDATESLRQAASEFEMARVFCLQLEERLTLEARAAKYGWEASNWVVEQGKELSVGIEELEIQLRDFNEEKVRFDGNAFSHQREASKKQFRIDA